MSVLADFGYEDGEVPERGDWDYYCEEETETQARERMSPTELEADLVFSDPFAEQ